jgi:hypothetical protein
VTRARRGHVGDMGRFTERMRRKRLRDEAPITWGGKIEHLRALLANAEEFADINDYFHAELVPDAGFRDAGALEHNADVAGLMETALRSRDPNGSFTGLILVHVASHGLWHGFGRWGEGLSTILYFEDPGMGLVCHVPSLSDPQIHFFRVTCVAPRDVTIPALSGPVTRGQA